MIGISFVIIIPDFSEPKISALAFVVMLNFLLSLEVIDFLTNMYVICAVA